MYKQLCVWPGTVLGDSSPEDFENFFLNEMEVRVKYHKEVLTLPDLDESGIHVEDTGGRNDLFFYVHDEDVKKFAIPRLKMGIRWWEDVVVYNNGSHLYSKEFLDENPPIW